MYICCALVGAIKDSVSQNVRSNSKKKNIYLTSTKFATDKNSKRRGQQQSIFSAMYKLKNTVIVYS